MSMTNNYDQTEYTFDNSEEDHYDSLSHICTDMCSKYAPESRNGTYHICAFFNKDKIIMGENSARKLGSCPISTHAEMDVLRKLYKTTQAPTGNKRIEKFDVLVIRISKTGKLGASRPCFHCINSMVNTSIVKIQNVYYSTNDGKIIKEKLDNMLDSDLTIVSTGWRVRTNKRKKNNSSPDNSLDSDKSRNRSSSPKNNNNNNTNKTMQVIDQITGERKLITEEQFQKDARQYQQQRRPSFM